MRSDLIGGKMDVEFDSFAPLTYFLSFSLFISPQFVVMCQVIYLAVSIR